MPLMIFGAGAIAGAVVGLVLGAMFQRRSAGATLFESRSPATAIALLALVVAAVALANSERDRGHDTTGASAPTTTATSAVHASTTITTTPGTSADELVIVPNVSHPPLTRKDAEAALQRVRLTATVQTLRLVNVPPGFVISQNPLPEATVSAGSTVTLVVSATP